MLTLLLSFVGLLLILKPVVILIVVRHRLRTMHRRDRVALAAACAASAWLGLALIVVPRTDLPPPFGALVFVGPFVVALALRITYRRRDGDERFSQGPAD